MQPKKLNIKTICSGIAMIALISGMASCEKFVDINTPPNAVGADNAYIDSATATATLLGIYSGMATGNISEYFNVIKYNAMSADEGYYVSNTVFDNFKNNTLTAGNETLQMYGDFYARIARANYVIGGLNASTTLPERVKNQLLGEAKFLRAWCYFQMVNFFGKVPLVTSTDASVTGLLPRAEVADVYKSIIADLTDARQLLSPNYPSGERARANRYVAAALLAKVYLYQSNWEDAETEATSVIGSGSYGMETDLSRVFLNNSNETIWQISLAGQSTPATIMGAEFLPTPSSPNFVLYDTLFNTFEANDKRKTMWTQDITWQGIAYRYPYKYKIKQTATGNEYPVVFRLAEMYLIRAEARAKQMKTEDGVKDINEVRGRANIALLPQTTGNAELLAAIEHERWVELFTEGDRWFNLKRLNRATAVLSLIKPAWQAYQQLYPIPDAERTKNLSLDDNPFY